MATQSIEKLKQFKLQGVAIILALMLFSYLLVSKRESLVTDLIWEGLITALLYFSFIAVVQFFTKLKQGPMRLVYSIMVVLCFFLAHVYLTKYLLQFINVLQSSGHPKDTFVANFLTTLYNGITLALAIIGLGFSKNLIFQKPKGNIKPFFNAMMIFLLATSFTGFLWKAPYKNYLFIHVALEVNAIILIFANSLRISWIAFLSKSEKKKLLLLSIVMIVLSSVLLGKLTGEEHEAITEVFSYSLEQFAVFFAVLGIIYFTVLFFTSLFHLPTAEVYDRKAKEVSSLQLFSGLINRVSDFEELLDRVTELAIEVCNADAAWVVFTDDTTKTPKSTKNIGYLDAEKIYNFCSVVPEGNVEGIQVIKLNDFYKNHKTIEVYNYAAFTPLKSHGTLYGYLVTCVKTDIPFDEEDKKALQSFSDYASIALDNARLLQESIEIERLEKELDVARDMQQKILPDKTPDLNQLEISASFIPAFEVGGDYYDFFTNVQDKLSFIIADVSGKGISAAFIMAELRGIFETLAFLVLSPKEILVKGNLILRKVLDRKSFVTATYGTLDLNTLKLKIARAGHQPALIVRSDAIIESISKGIGLGINYSTRFGDLLQEVEIDLQPKDILVFFTDGVTESKNNELEDYGIERLKETILANSKAGAELIIQRIIESITKFTQGAHQHDDITLVVMRIKTNNGEI